MMTSLLPLLLTASAWAGEGASPDEGIPWATIGFHAMNLVILLAIIVWFGGKPIRDAIADRATNIRNQIKESSALHKDALARYEQMDARLSSFEAVAIQFARRSVSGVSTGSMDPSLFARTAPRRSVADFCIITQLVAESEHSPCRQCSGRP